ncbi:MAG: glycosyltransferase family 2 protein [Bacillota bacterium]
MDLSVIVITHNEEKNIRDCLESVKWAGEIVVVDAYSTDKTVKICKKYTDRIFLNRWPGYSKQRTFALEKASRNWILALDADERVSPELAEGIKKIVSGQAVANSYYLPLKNYFLGKWLEHCGAYPSFKLKLFRKGYAKVSEREVQEEFYPLHSQPHILDCGSIQHYSYASLEQYIDKFNRHTTLNALEMKKNNLQFSSRDIIKLPVDTFLDMYIQKEGFMDGLHGLIFCVLSSMYVFVSHAKLWSMESNNPVP